MKVLIFGDANVDVTASWQDVEKNLGRLSSANKRLISECIAKSRRDRTDVEYCLNKQNPEMSKFFNSLNPRVEFGGCGAIKAKTMAMLGHKVVFYSWVGDDGNGMMLLDELSEAGVDTSHVLVSGKTRETYNLFDPKEKRVGFSYWQSKLDFSGFLKAVKKERPDLVFLTGAHRIKKGLGYAKLPGAYVFGGSFATYTRKELDAKYKADFSRGLLVVNDSEAMQLSGAADALSGVGCLPNGIVVMHGQLQTAVRRGGEILAAGTGGKIDRSKVKELTGIGDVWEAVFLGSVGDLRTASPDKIIRCMKTASKAAVNRMLTGKFPSGSKESAFP